MLPTQELPQAQQIPEPLPSNLPERALQRRLEASDADPPTEELPPTQEIPPAHQASESMPQRLTELVPQRRQPRAKNPSSRAKSTGPKAQPQHPIAHGLQTMLKAARLEKGVLGAGGRIATSTWNPVQALEGKNKPEVRHCFTQLVQIGLAQRDLRQAHAQKKGATEEPKPLEDARKKCATEELKPLEDARKTCATEEPKPLEDADRTMELKESGEPVLVPVSQPAIEDEAMRQDSSTDMDQKHRPDNHRCCEDEPPAKRQCKEAQPSNEQQADNGEQEQIPVLGQCASHGPEPTHDHDATLLTDAVAPHNDSTDAALQEDVPVLEHCDPDGNNAVHDDNVMQPDNVAKHKDCIPIKNDGDTSKEDVGAENKSGVPAAMPEIEDARSPEDEDPEAVEKETSSGDSTPCPQDAMHSLENGCKDMTDHANIGSHIPLLAAVPQSEDVVDEVHTILQQLQMSGLGEMSEVAGSIDESMVVEMVRRMQQQQQEQPLMIQAQEPTTPASIGRRVPMCGTELGSASSRPYRRLTKKSRPPEAIEMFDHPEDAVTDAEPRGAADSMQIVAFEALPLDSQTSLHIPSVLLTRPLPPLQETHEYELDPPLLPPSAPLSKGPAQLCCKPKENDNQMQALAVPARPRLLPPPVASSKTPPAPPQEALSLSAQSPTPQHSNSESPWQNSQSLVPSTAQCGDLHAKHCLDGLHADSDVQTPTPQHSNSQLSLQDSQSLIPSTQCGDLHEDQSHSLANLQKGPAQYLVNMNKRLLAVEESLRLMQERRQGAVGMMKALEVLL